MEPAGCFLLDAIELPFLLNWYLLFFSLMYWRFILKTKGLVFDISVLNTTLNFYFKSQLSHVLYLLYTFLKTFQQPFPSPNLHHVFYSVHIFYLHKAMPRITSLLCVEEKWYITELMFLFALLITGPLLQHGFGVCLNEPASPVYMLCMCFNSTAGLNMHIQSVRTHLTLQQAKVKRLESPKKKFYSTHYCQHPECNVCWIRLFRNQSVYELLWKEGPELLFN